MSWIEISRREAPFGLGDQPRLHRGSWYVLHGGRPHRWGFGQLPNPNNVAVISSADAVITYFQSNACTQASIPAVSQFQSDYNASGQAGTLTVDGQYGGNTQRALDNTIALAAQQNGQATTAPLAAAPQNCFGMAEPGTPAVDTTPTTPAAPASNTTPVTSTTTSTTDWTPLLIGGAVVAGGGLLAWAYLKKHPMRRHRHA